MFEFGFGLGNGPFARVSEGQETSDNYFHNVHAGSEKTYMTKLYCFFLLYKFPMLPAFLHRSIYSEFTHCFEMPFLFLYAVAQIITKAGLSTVRLVRL